MAEYHLSDGADRIGPFDVDQLVAMGIVADTAVLASGSEQWTRAGDEPALAAALTPIALAAQEVGELSTMGVQAAAAMHWGPFKDDGIVGPGFRKYSSILWDIPGGQDWLKACVAMPATINGHYFARPTKCVHTGFAMWGEFHVPDATGNAAANAVVFLAPEFPLNLGHVGWGFKMSDGNWCWGSTENAGVPPVIAPGADNGCFIERGTKQQMMACFRDGKRKDGVGKYWKYRLMKVLYAPNPSPTRAQGMAEVTKRAGYSFVGNNCMDHTIQVINGYAGLPIVPLTQIGGPVTWIPNNWFGLIGALPKSTNENF